MNLVISVPKTGKAYNKKLEQTVFVNKKIGEEVLLDEIGLQGCKAVITGGSDKDGFPMRKTISGIGRRKVLMSKGVGFKAKRRGERKRVTVRANTVGEDIHQLNLKIIETGREDIEKVLGKKEEKTGKEEKKEERTEEKEKGEEKRKPKEELKGEKEKEEEEEKSGEEKTEAKTVEKKKGEEKGRKTEEEEKEGKKGKKKEEKEEKETGKLEEKTEEKK